VGLIAHGLVGDRTLARMLAVVPVRNGVLPAGAAEAIAECDGRVLIVGSGTAELSLDGVARDVRLLELGPVEPNRWTAALVPVIEQLPDADIVVLPHSPDGRDLAPHLALALDRPLHAGATQVGEHRVRVARRGGLELHEQRPTGAFVATLQPGARGIELVDGSPTVEKLDHPTPDQAGTADAHVVEVLPPDVRTMDLAEAHRIVGGGAGLQTEERFAQLDRFAATIGGVMGATRVITDRGWVHHDRQIGTTGVVVDPVVYVSFGVSGAVQHTSGLGTPDHIISVNTDPHCPMMAMSDLAIVADANATLDELMDLLGESVGPASVGPASGERATDG
jgi:electron transfer flavoprotein alpha subunit